MTERHTTRSIVHSGKTATAFSLVMLFMSGQICLAQNYVHRNVSAGGSRYKGHIAYAPAGLTMPVRLDTSLSSIAAQEGDPVLGSLSRDVQLGTARIPAGTVLSGRVTNAKAGGRLGRSGQLGIKFYSMRLPDGVNVPISAHISGGLEKLHANGDDSFKGENGGTKVKDAALRGAIGAGAGAVLGTAIGGIAGHGRGAGRGAWSGTAIGAGAGLADSFLIRKGHDVTIRSGTILQLQLDQAVSIADRTCLM